MQLACYFCAEPYYLIVVESSVRAVFQGAERQGIKEHIKVKKKMDSMGVGKVSLEKSLQQKNVLGGKLILPRNSLWN